jgi:hypothetical protein
MQSDYQKLSAENRALLDALVKARRAAGATDDQLRSARA